MRIALMPCVLLATAGTGCLGSISISSPTTAGLSSSGTGSLSSGAVAASGSSGANTASSSGTTGGTASSAGTTGTSAGSSTGTTGRRPPPVYVDGGYVRCEASLATDGGERTLTWECRPGTYFCATDGSETCAQCLSDSDCGNDDLPTFDPRRPYCDLSSGVIGYQGFCQQCLASAQCAGNPAGPYCDLNPADWEPPIETTGFETCAAQPLGCPPTTSPGLGGCLNNRCSTDKDCAGALTPSQQLEPYCVQGGCATTPAGNACPDCECGYGVACGSPGPAALACDGDRCVCTDQTQCGGAWPVCELPPGGEDGGTCGCSADIDCGDAGLRCLTYPATYLPATVTFGGSACAVPCDYPGFPACSLWSASAPVCDPSGGFCEPCGSDNDCQTKAGGPSDGPFCRLDGVCGCARDSDCPKGQTCQDIDVQSRAGGLLGVCVLPPAPCTTGRCGGPSCRIDEDCWSSSSGRICEADSGRCGSCQSDSDCMRLGFGAYGESMCDLSTLTCAFGCTADPDCVGNTSGPHCISGSRCGCGSDLDCAGNPSGGHCDTTVGDDLAGYCFCLDSSNCPAGENCSAAPGQALTCSSYCYYSDGGCPAGFFCDPNYVCRARCDPGHSCQAPDPFCDTDDIAGQNSIGDPGDGGSEDAGPGDVVWCYGCLGPSDCDSGLVCDQSAFSCSSQCYESQDCSADAVCLASDGTCHSLCDGGACPNGEACDADNLAHQGPDICYQCLSPSDCPDGQGCNGRLHTCGTCRGPTAQDLQDDCRDPYDEFCGDCPPDAVCSNYWGQNIDADEVPNGVCLQNCDFSPCPDGKTCAVLPDLTPYHAYCFGCLSDADCADAGPRAWCDDSLYLTFTCRPAI